MAELCEPCLDHDKMRPVREFIYCTNHLGMHLLEGRDKDDNEIVEDIAEYERFCAKLGHLRYSESDQCECERLAEAMEKLEAQVNG
jgi:hypothetical protein